MLSITPAARFCKLSIVISLSKQSELIANCRPKVRLLTKRKERAGLALARVRFAAARAHGAVVLGFAAAAAALLPAEADFVNRRPCAAFCFGLAGAAALVALLDVFGLTLLFVRVLRFAALRHGESSFEKILRDVKRGGNIPSASCFQLLFFFRLFFVGIFRFFRFLGYFEFARFGLVAFGLCDFGQLFVRGLFLVERFFEKISGFVVAHRFGPRAQSAVRGNFVVFNFLRSGNDGGVARTLVVFI